VSGQQGPQGEKEKMKTNLFTIALAVATMVPVFGAQAQNPATPAKPAASSTQSSTTDANKPAATTKKHHKKAVKKDATKSTTSTVVKPAAPASDKK
jgi:hypothetical protein